MQEKFRKDTFSVGLNNIAVNIFSFAAAVILARALGPINQGLLAIIITIADVLNKFISLGTRSSVLYFINSKQYSAKQVYDTVVSSSFVLSFVLAIGVFIFYRPSFSAQPILTIQSMLYIPIFIGSYLILNFMRANVLGIFYALENFKTANFNNLVYFGLPAILIAILWPLQQVNLPNILLVYLFNSLVSVILVFVAMKSVKLSYSFSFDWQLFKKMLTFGLPVYYNGIVQTLQQRAGIFFISSSLGLSHVGYFTVAYSIADKLNELSKPVVVTHFPKATQYHAQSPKLALSFTKEIISKLLATYLIFEIPFIILVPILLPLIYSSDYSPSVYPTLILSASTILWGLISILNNFFAASYLHAKNSIILTIGLLLNMAGFYLIYLKKASIISISISISVSCLVIILIQLFYIRSKFKADLTRVFPDFKGAINVFKSFLGRRAI